MHKHILLPTDGSTLSHGAVRYGIALARAVGAKVTGITVSAPFRLLAIDPEILTDTPQSYKARMEIVAEKALAQLKAAASEANIEAEAVHEEHEHPYQAIIDAANERGCDLIVMASHGRRGVAAIVLGSETLKVLTHSTVPVLVYREDDRREPGLKIRP